MTENITRKMHTGEPGNAGHFGSKVHDESPVQLAAAPATIRVRLEAWEYSDQLVELEVIEFDGRVLLDAVHADDIDVDSNEEDGLYFDAVRLGLAKDHNGPFSVYLDDPSVEDYLAQRRADGAIEPLTSTPRRTVEQLDEALNELDVARNELMLKETAVRVEAITSILAEEHPDADMVELWVTDDGTTVAEVLDKDGQVIWNGSDGDSGIDRWVSTLDAAQPRFDRPADSSHSRPWRGFSVRD